MCLNQLSKRDVLEALCYYNPRNPWRERVADEDDGPYNPAARCSCDNCFYGLDRLARALLHTWDACEHINTMAGLHEPPTGFKAVWREAISTAQDAINKAKGA